MVRTSRILMIFSFFLTMIPVRATDPSPQQLPKDPAVQTGTLPDGVTYYIVTNKSEKGMAEFALVQKGSAASSPGESIEKARASITRIPMLGNGSARDFMIRNGISSAMQRRKPAGPVEATEDALIYRFGTFAVSGKETLIDSTLLMMFGIIDARDKDRTPSPSSYAMIVAGDVNKDKVLSKMKMLSMLVPPAAQTDAPAAEGVYEWKKKDTVECVIGDTAPDGIAEVSVTYSSPRTPKEYMGSAITTVSGHMVDILTKIITRRLSVEMRRSDVPVAGIYCRYYQSSDGPGDEKYTVTVKTAPEYARKTVQIIAYVLSDLDHNGSLPKEYSDARNEYMIQLYRESLNPLTGNVSYVENCISSFLYNAGISTKAEKFRFLSRGQMADTARTRLFNNFVSELLDSTLNLTLSLNADTLMTDVAGLKTAFSRAWEEAALEPVLTSYSTNMSDTLALVSGKPGKMKIVQTRPEPVSGGTMWIFANGLKVVYKRMETSGLFYYNMMIRGGYSCVKDIRRGEGAFFSDVLETYDIAGLPSTSFNHLMLSGGITMSSKVGVSDMNIYGMAPRPSLTLLFKCLSAVANDRSINAQAFGWWRQGEALRLKDRAGTLPDRITAMDSLLCPSYNYSPYPSEKSLYSDLPERTMSFYDDQFSRVNDGVLVIVGDMEETAMRKFLLKNIGRFKTQPAAAARIRLPYQPISGWTTHTGGGQKQSLDVIMSAQLPFTADNYMAMKVMTAAMEEELNDIMSGMGVAVNVSSVFADYPQERINLLVSMVDLDPDTLPLGEEPEDPLVLLFKLRTALSELSSEALPDDRVKLYRNIVRNNIASSQNDPWYWIDAVNMRYAAGKDMNTKYSEKVDAVTAARIKEIISLLNSSSKVEYVVR